MRKIAAAKTQETDVKRVMIYDDGTGICLFLYDRDEDGPGMADHWFESLDEAEAVCSEEYGIDSTDWEFIPDPMPDGQHDWIRPTRVKRDANGNKLWGQFESVPDTL